MGRRLLLTGLACAAALAVVLGLAPAATARAWPGHPGRHLVVHRVRPGETVTGLATRFHAWTAELRRVNHLHRDSVLYAGQRIRIPVVEAAVRRAHRERHRHHGLRPYDRRMRVHGWRHYRMSRAKVRHLIVRTARRNHVPRSLALAIAWQESGWHQPLVSADRAVGVMQLLPATADWMSLYVGRRLNARDTYDNVAAGVALVGVLRDQTRHDRTAIAAYYQGLGAVRRHGVYPSTRHYVRNVRAIRRSLHAGNAP